MILNFNITDVSNSLFIILVYSLVFVLFDRLILLGPSGTPKTILNSFWGKLCFLLRSSFEIWMWALSPHRRFPCKPLFLASIFARTGKNCQVFLVIWNAYSKWLFRFKKSLKIFISNASYQHFFNWFSNNDFLRNRFFHWAILCSMWQIQTRNLHVTPSIKMKPKTKLKLLEGILEDVLAKLKRPRHGKL